MLTQAQIPEEPLSDQWTTTQKNGYPQWLYYYAVYGKQRGLSPASDQQLPADAQQPIRTMGENIQILKES